MDTLKNKEIEEMAENVSIKPNGWNEWAKYVLINIEQIIKSHKELEVKVDDNKVAYIEAVNALQLEMVKQFGEFKKEISVIKTRMERRAIWISSIAGGIPALVALIYFIINKL